MLTFEEKLAIIEGFPQLSKKEVSLGRLNFQYDKSVSEKKNVVFHLHPNGNGFVYAGRIPGQKKDAKGYANIRDFSKSELTELIQASIDSLSEPASETFVEETYENDNGFTLTLVKEGDLFNVYAGEMLDGTFLTHPGALSYLAQEGFRRKYY
ncbi:MAG: hypothetical protein FWF59_15795 [Turicibacter sp.]|nr:hypothetical protein [Turicibacter sp.]